MKKLLLLLLVTMSISCENPGTSKEVINPDNDNLPKHLKGLKVDRVYLEENDFIYVATLDSTINSVSYNQGKSRRSVILLSESKERTIVAKEIISETDSIIVLRK